MQKGTILSIDDDEDLQLVVEHYLENDGYKLLKAHNIESALEKVEIGELNVILLDLVLPDGEGLSLIPQLQSKTNAAIIVVSGKNDTTEKIICLEMGADDYLTKPFEMRELSARIKAVMRRIDNIKSSNDDVEQEHKIIFGNGWCLDRTQYQLYDKDNKSADLTTGEFKLLETLILSANRALSREQLFELTRDGEYDAYDRAIDIQIGRIRKKIDQDESADTLIKTIRGVGYMFIK